MQLVSGFMQMAAAGRIGAIKYIFTVFLKGKLLIVHQTGITIFLIFIWGGISPDIRSKFTYYGSANARRRKLNIRPYIRRYTSSNENLNTVIP